MAIRIARIARLIAGLWGGALLSIGFIGAPAGFAVASREVAGRLAGRMFAQEAYLSLAAAAVMFFLIRGRPANGEVTAKRVDFEVLMVLLTLFCTIAGYFALVPMMAAARAGLGTLSFGTLHALSAGFYGVKTLAVVVLAWRLSEAALCSSRTDALNPEPSF